MKYENEIVQKGVSIYDSIKDKIRRDFPLGNYVAIEVDSGQFFVGKDEIESVHKAKEKFPNKLFFIAGVGRMEGRI